MSFRNIQGLRVAFSMIWVLHSRLLATALAVLPLSATALDNPCVFCDATYTYDLSRLPTQTYVAHSGTPGSQDERDSYVTYLVTSPCGSAKSDLCISGPTSDPLAMRGSPPKGGGSDTVCTGLGTLNATYGEVKIATSGSSGLVITLHNKLSNGGGTTNFNIVCDKNVPMDNPPDPSIARSYAPKDTFNVTWRHPSACDPVPTPAGGCALPAPNAAPEPECEACLPRWRPTWNMSRSTALYGCNSSGPHNVEEAASYGITVYDWSHSKFEWVNNHPMNDDDMLLRQAEAVLSVDPGVPGEQPRVWVYRNKIKALNWIGQVREKLDDPQYAGWFVRFKNYKGIESNNSYYPPACDWYGDSKSGPPKCSGFYHDQTQSPTRIGAGAAYCRVGHDNHNVCREQCDCGATNPCGEYTFDHRNSSFSEWWVNEYMISKKTLLHDPPINLGWLDDGIGLSGVSESAPPGTWANDTGMTPADMQDHYDSFRANIAKLQRAVVDRGAFYWQMIKGNGPKVRNVAPRKNTCHEPAARNVTAEQCAATLRDWCNPRPSAWRIAHLYFVCPDEMVDDNIARDATAEFLLTRGDFAWIGYSWAGCFPMPTSNSTKLRPRPKLWDTDFGGAPDGPCVETETGSGVFKRQYPRAEVQWDCNRGMGDIQMR